MSGKKHTNSLKEKTGQKKRTYRNQARRYARLIAAHPKCGHLKKWESNLTFYSKTS